MTIAQILSTISQAEAKDETFLVAAAINLYSESIRRRAGRILYGPADVTALTAIITTLLKAAEIEQTYEPPTDRADIPSALELELLNDPAKMKRV